MKAIAAIMKMKRFGIKHNIQTELIDVLMGTAH